MPGPSSAQSHCGEKGHPPEQCLDTSRKHSHQPCSLTGPCHQLLPMWQAWLHLSSQKEAEHLQGWVGGIHWPSRLWESLLLVNFPVQGMEPPRAQAWPSLLHALREEPPGCQDPAHHCLATPSLTFSTHCSPAPAPPVPLIC